MKEKNGEHPNGDAGQIILMIIYLVVWVADSFFLKWTTQIASHVSLAVRSSVGGGMMVAALLIGRASLKGLLDPANGDRVIREGIYGYIRHPLYLASKLIYLSLFHLTFSLAALVVMIAASRFYNHIATYEEKLMIDRFGVEYEDYIMATGRWYPRIRRRRM